MSESRSGSESALVDVRRSDSLVEYLGRGLERSQVPVRVVVVVVVVCRRMCDVCARAFEGVPVARSSKVSGQIARYSSQKTRLIDCVEEMQMSG